MIIEKVDPGRECFGDYSLDGAMLTIGGVIIDLEEEESDQEVVISFCRCNGSVHRGLMRTAQCAYVAEVVIPPRRYEETEVEDEPVVLDEDEDEDEEEQNTHTERIPLPLDIDSVKLKLWPVDDQIENKEEEPVVQEGEEENAE